MAGRVLPEDPWDSGVWEATAIHVTVDNEGELRTLIERALNSPRPAIEDPDALAAVDAGREASAEALRRLDRGEPFEAVRDWLFGRFRAINPLPEPEPRSHLCSCGAVLLEPGWSGRLTVLCEVCGTKWGAEMRSDGSCTVWTIDRPEATIWRPVDEESPEDAERWQQLFLSTIADLGGNADEVRSTFQLERSLDGSPREIRLVHPFGESSLLLWEGANVDLWLQGSALDEVQRQRKPRSGTVDGVDGDEAETSFDDDVDDEFVDLEQYEYVALAENHSDLATRALDRYIEILMSFARLPESAEREARSCQLLDVSVDADVNVVRWLSRVTGTTSWYDDWDGTCESLIEIAEWKALNDAEWLDDERRLHGETGWEA